MRPAPAVPLRRNWLGVAAVLACALATAATSPLPVSYPRNYPEWRLTSLLRLDQGSLRVRGWFSKSGKEGVGLTLRLRSCGEAMVGRDSAARPPERGGAAPIPRVAVTRASLEVAGAGSFAAELPLPVELAPGATRDLYLPFAFDNERLWNDGRRSGQLLVELVIDGRRHVLALAAQHVLEGFHREVRRGDLPVRRLAPSPDEQCPAPLIAPPGARVAPTSAPAGTVLEPRP